MNSIGVPNDTSGTAVPISVEPISTLNGTPVSPVNHGQRFIFAIRTGPGVVVDLSGDAIHGANVAVTRLPIANTVLVTMVAVTATGAVLKSANASRTGCQVFNHSTQWLRGKYDDTSTLPVVAPVSFAVAPRGTWEMPLPIYQGAITGVWDKAEADATMTGANITEET